MFHCIGTHPTRGLRRSSVHARRNGGAIGGLDGRQLQAFKNTGSRRTYSRVWLAIAASDRDSSGGGGGSNGGEGSGSSGGGGISNSVCGDTHGNVCADDTLHTRDVCLVDLLVRGPEEVFAHRGKGHQLSIGEGGLENVQVSDLVVGEEFTRVFAGRGQALAADGEPLLGCGGGHLEVVGDGVAGKNLKGGVAGRNSKVVCGCWMILGSPSFVYPSRQWFLRLQVCPFMRPAGQEGLSR